MTSPVDHTGNFWERQARRDPLWAILSDPTKKGRKWNLRQFLETGAREISLVMYLLGELRVVVSGRKALDFGCGVGRCTLALGDYFDERCGREWVGYRYFVRKRRQHRPFTTAGCRVTRSAPTVPAARRR